MKGSKWYFEVNEYCQNLSDLYNIPVIKVAGALSALSPNTTFEHNCRSLEKFIRTNGNCKVTTFNSQKEKARQILFSNKELSEDEIKDLLGKGLKTRSFFENIYRPSTSQAVTVDLWMIRWAKKIGLMPEKGTLTDKRYKLIEKEIQTIASDVKMLPHSVQAFVWCDIRGKEY